MELLGWLGASCGALCGLPQAITCLKNGHSRGLSRLMLVLWFCGSFFCLLYILATPKYPLIFSYVFNITVVSIMIRYSFFERKPKAAKKPEEAKLMEYVQTPGDAENLIVPAAATDAAGERVA